MSTQTLPKDRSLSTFLAKSSVLDKWCRTLLFKKLESLQHGRLTIEDHSLKDIVKTSFGTATDLTVTLTVKKSSFFSRTLLGGSIGTGESYIDRDWECEDLTNLIRLFVLNRDLLNAIDSQLGSLLQPFQRYMHGLRHNTISGSRENIRSHYDIGNDFFKLFLDKTMMYSSAVFETPATPLVEASIHKLQLICERLDLRPTDHLLEIGTGWGSMAIFAAQHYGCQVTTTTISTEQFNYAQEQVKLLGLEQKVTVLFEDYRHLTGVYDKLVSIEMIEAVGLNNLNTYFEKCSSLLKDHGLMVLQAITIRDSYYESAKKSVDFIQRHIFPGCGIPSVSAIMSSVSQTTDLVLAQQQDFAEDYAQTLKIWSENLHHNQQAILKLGYPDYLLRLWHFYFSYCEGGFRERALGLSQMTLTKPNYRNRSLL